ncbi:unnamed protein product, partial [Amoebophrya sp. A25]|eukprot:GSA25T00013251001.1
MPPTQQEVDTHTSPIVETAIVESRLLNAQDAFVSPSATTGDNTGPPTTSGTTSTKTSSMFSRVLVSTTASVEIDVTAGVPVSSAFLVHMQDQNVADEGFQ